MFTNVVFVEAALYS